MERGRGWPCVPADDARYVGELGSSARPDRELQGGSSHARTHACWQARFPDPCSGANAGRPADTPMGGLVETLRLLPTVHQPLVCGPFIPRLSRRVWALASLRPP